MAVRVADPSAQQAVVRQRCSAPHLEEAERPAPEHQDVQALQERQAQRPRDAKRPAGQVARETGQGAQLQGRRESLQVRQDERVPLLT